ncbi:MAG TPA: hypothetical protein VFC05_01585 [Nitrososphaeraceae archaeon]|nr:hypothetical protein [Nitrososphaeraceae archaeon]
MDKRKVISDNPSTDAERTELIMVRVTASEKEYFETLTSLLSELDVDGKGTKVIKNNSLSDFVRISLSIASNFYIQYIFSNSSVMSKLLSNKAKNEFISFRTKYMNISNDFS